MRPHQWPTVKVPEELWDMTVQSKVYASLQPCDLILNRTFVYAVGAAMQSTLSAVSVRHRCVMSTNKEVNTQQQRVSTTSRQVSLASVWVTALITPHYKKCYFQRCM